MRIVVVIMALQMVSGLADALESGSTGFRQQGNGVWAEVAAPVSWNDGYSYKVGQIPDRKNPSKTKGGIVWQRDVGKAHGVQWRIPLPNWSNSSPIVVGDKVFVMAEPLDYAPLLLCISTIDGKELWRRELDHLTAIDADELAVVRESWRQRRALARQWATLWAEKRRLGGQDESLAAWQEKAAALGFVLSAKGKDQGKWGGIRLDASQVPPELDENKALLQRFNCRALKWELGIGSQGRFQVGAYTGFTQPTPVSDGRFVYMYTGYHHVVAYDLQGTLHWQRWLGTCAPARSGGWMDFTQSPVLVDGKLLVGNKTELTALDAQTGAVLWKQQCKPEHRALTKGDPQLTGVVVRLQNEAYFFWFDGCLYRVRDGAVSAKRVLGGDVLVNYAAALVADNRLVVCTGSKKQYAVSAWDCSLDPDGLPQAQLAWKHDVPESPQSGALFEGRIYLPIDKTVKMGRYSGSGSGLVLNLADGHVIQNSTWKNDHYAGIVIAGRRIYAPVSLRNGKGVMRVYDLAGKKLAENILSSASQSPERLALIRSQTGSDNWNGGWHGSFHALPAFAGNKLFIRSRDELFCIASE